MIQERYAPAVRTRTASNRAVQGHILAQEGGRHAVRTRARFTLSIGNSVLVQMALAMTLVAFAAMIYLFQASQVSIQEMNIADLQAQQVQLRADTAAAQMVAASLQSIPRVDAIASNQLHMTKPDISSSMWITPISRSIPVLRPVNADAVAAQQQSQPLAWMKHFAAFVLSSL